MMTTYAIGSVNGDYQSLIKLIEKINFDPEQDKLWFSGNVVNIGPDSLQVLKYIKELGKQAVLVLGNQELRLLGLATGFYQVESTDTLDEILLAPERDALLKWLRQRPLLFHDSKLNYTLVHAGIPAEWTKSQILTFAYEVESVLGGSNFAAFFENRKQDQTGWHPKLRGWKRLNFIANAYTLMKYCNERSRLDFFATGDISQQPDNLTPWYRLPGRVAANLNVVFSDDANFGDEVFPGVYPIPAYGELSALKLTISPELITV